MPATVLCRDNPSKFEICCGISPTIIIHSSILAPSLKISDPSPYNIMKGVLQINYENRRYKVKGKRYPDALNLNQAREHDGIIAKRQPSFSVNYNLEII